MALRFLLLLPLVACYVLQQPPPLAGGWVTATLQNRDMNMTVILALKKQNMDQLRNLVDSVSNPQSSQYSHYLSNTEVHRLTSPTTDAMIGVAAWLDQNNVHHTFSVGMDTVVLRVTAAEAERLFSTTISMARNVFTKQSVVRARAINVPEEVAHSIQAVFGVHGLPLPPRNNIRDTPRGPGDVASVTPDTIIKTYKISGVTVSGGNKNRQAVAEFTGQWMNQQDLTQFFKTYVPNAKSGEDQVFKYVGDKQSGSGVEAMLDIEYIMGVAPGIKTEFWAWGSNNFCSDLKQWSDTILATTNGPNVHSVSYGWQGDMIGQPSCTEQEVAAVEENFQKIAATGVSIIFASGDSGSGWTEDIRCSYQSGFKFSGTPTKTITANPSACCDACSAVKTCKGWTSTYSMPTANDTSSKNGLSVTCKLYAAPGTQSPDDYSWSGTPTTKPQPLVKLWPSWPASSPYITAVGSTRFIDQKAGNPEMSTDQFGSGGGFSWNWTAPAWQQGAVKAYFDAVDKSTLPAAGSYPPKGRATPDLAALGEGYQVIVEESTKTVGGTSASTPAFAGMVSLLNEARIAKGKKPLGLLNQWIYQNSAAFTDITVGWDRYGRNPFVTAEGFNCTKGWDPVSGWGTPDFGKLLAAALAAP